MLGGSDILSLIIAGLTYPQVGGLYAPGDHHRDRAYAIFHVGINIGAFQAPLICGTLGEEASRRARQAMQYHWRDYEISAGFIGR